MNVLKMPVEMKLIRWLMDMAALGIATSFIGL